MIPDGCFVGPDGCFVGILHLGPTFDTQAISDLYIYILCFTFKSIQSVMQRVRGSPFSIKIWVGDMRSFNLLIQTELISIWGSKRLCQWLVVPIMPSELVFQWDRAAHNQSSQKTNQPMTEKPDLVSCLRRYHSGIIQVLPPRLRQFGFKATARW